jgi:hypothetical protein
MPFGDEPMPVRELASKHPPEYADLVGDLVREWKNPSESPEPVILFERDSKKLVVHVYVIWGAWRDTDRIARSEIIMDAAEQALAPDEVLNITIAMGLTPEEAKRLGIG